MPRFLRNFVLVIFSLAFFSSIGYAEERESGSSIVNLPDTIEGRYTIVAPNGNRAYSNMFGASFKEKTFYLWGSCGKTEADISNLKEENDTVTFVITLTKAAFRCDRPIGTPYSVALNLKSKTGNYKLLSGGIMELRF